MKKNEKTRCARNGRVIWDRRSDCERHWLHTAYVLTVAARRTDRLEALVERIEQAGGEAIALSVDVTDEQQVQMMVHRLQEQWGRLDILVNSAGLMLLGPIAGADTEEWRRMISTNVLGLLYATHAVLPMMQAQGSGHIVNISSLAGRIARAGSGVYNATKWGVGAFSEALRQECVRDHIRVTVIEPGIVETDLASHTTNIAARENALRRRQNIDPLQSEDIANAIVLCSDSAAACQRQRNPARPNRTRKLSTLGQKFEVDIVTRVRPLPSHLCDAYL